MIDRDALVGLDLDEYLERRRRLPLEHRLLRAATPRLLVGERDRLDPADEVGERGAEHEVLKGVAVRGREELYAALGDGAGGRGLLLGADLVDDHDLGHVVLDGLDHPRALQRGRLHLHAPRASDARVRDVAVPRDLVRGVHHDDPLAEIVRQHARDLAQHRGLAHAGPAEEQHAAPGFDDVAEDLDGAVDRTPDTERETHDLARAIAECADAVERALDARAVVTAELADVRDDIRDVLG